MRLLLLLTCSLVLALAVAPAALAQVADDAPDADQVDPTPEPEATPDPCEARGPGTDGDYAYCGDPCATLGVENTTDADYAYCLEAAGGIPTPVKRETARPVAEGAQLPLTGGDPAPIALLGLAFLMIGTGLRVRGSGR